MGEHSGQSPSALPPSADWAGAANTNPIPAASAPSPGPRACRVNTPSHQGEPRVVQDWVISGSENKPCVTQLVTTSPPPQAGESHWDQTPSLTGTSTTRHTPAPPHPAPSTHTSCLLAHSSLAADGTWPWASPWEPRLRCWRRKIQCRRLPRTQQGCGQLRAGRLRREAGLRPWVRRPWGHSSVSTLVHRHGCFIPVSQLGQGRAVPRWRLLSGSAPALSLMVHPYTTGTRNLHLGWVQKSLS